MAKNSWESFNIVISKVFYSVMCNTYQLLYQNIDIFIQYCDTISDFGYIDGIQ